MSRASRIARLAERVKPLAASEDHKRLQARLGAAYREYLEEQDRASWDDPAADEHWIEWCDAHGEGELVDAFDEALRARVAELDRERMEGVRAWAARVGRDSRRQDGGDEALCRYLLPHT